MDWPPSCKKRWAKHGGANHIPPFYFLCHLAEFQRLGQNSVALMRLSFNEDGEELSIRRLKEKMSDTMDMAAGKRNRFAGRQYPRLARNVHLIKRMRFCRCQKLTKLGMQIRQRLTVNVYPTY